MFFKGCHSPFNRLPFGVTGAREQEAPQSSDEAPKTAYMQFPSLFAAETGTHVRKPMHLDAFWRAAGPPRGPVQGHVGLQLTSRIVDSRLKFVFWRHQLHGLVRRRTTFQLID